jgi:uncharacterized coiled-coil protein SlyX
MGLKDLFIKSDNDKQSVQQQPVQTTPVQQPVQTAAPVYQPVQQPVQTAPIYQPTQPVGVGIPNSTLGVATPNVASPDPAIVDELWKAIIKENRPGPDYLELKNNVEALEDMPMTADQKILGAFKILQKQYPNFKKDDITDAVGYYIEVINRERETGLTELNQLRVSTVDTVNDTIADKQQELLDLRQKMTDLQNEIVELNTNMLKAKADVEEKEAVFAASVEAVLSVLNSDISKIQTINF